VIYLLIDMRRAKNISQPNDYRQEDVESN
jgi:hypothetical protein